MTRALMPGSYDPITLGHRAVIEQALARFDEVVVAVMNNADKSYLFSMEERTEIARLALADLPRVRVVCDAGLLVDLFDRVGATAIVKGVRNDADRAYEEKMAAWNKAHNPRAETILLDAPPALREVSSTRVREMLKKGQRPDGLLSPAVLAYLSKKGEY